MDGVRSVTEQLIREIKDTEEYFKYQKKKEKIKEWPELKVQLDEYRLRNFELQNRVDPANLFEEIDHFHKEYEGFREDARVASFLDAELAFCRMIQGIYDNIMENIDFE